MPQWWNLADTSSLKGDAHLSFRDRGPIGVHFQPLLDKLVKSLSSNGRIDGECSSHSERTGQTFATKYLKI